MEDVQMFFAAVLAGNESEVAKLLVDSPKLVQAVDELGQTALHCAAREGHSKVVTQLLAANPCGSSTSDPNGRTALHIAASRGHGAVVEQLLTECQAVDGAGWLPLHTAIYMGHEAIAERLLAAYPAGVHAKSIENNTVLHLGVRGARCRVEFLKRLWLLAPELLRGINKIDHNPFFDALCYENDKAIEMWQGEFSVDDLTQIVDSIERWRPFVLERVTVPLPRELAAVVCEFLFCEPPRKSPMWHDS